jgi:hydrogenase-4 component E
MFRGLEFDIAHTLSASVLVLSFALLYQRRVAGVIHAFALQAAIVAAAAAWQAWTQDAPHLYVTALVALAFKSVFVPIALMRIVRQLGVQQTIENVIEVNAALLAGVALVALSILLVYPMTASSGALTRENLALALSIVLIGLMIMIVRRNAAIQVIGFMSLENGLVLAAVGVQGMPLVVEMSIAFSVLVAFLIFGMFFFRIRERFDTLDLQRIEEFRGDRAHEPPP